MSSTPKAGELTHISRIVELIPTLVDLIPSLVYIKSHLISSSYLSLAYKYNGIS